MPSRVHVHQFGFVAYNRQCMTDDTEDFLRFLDPDPLPELNASRPSGTPTGSPIQRIRELSLACEDRYLAWRDREPTAALGVSRLTFDMMSGQIADFLPRIAIGLVAAGHRGLDADAMRTAEESLGYLSSVAVIKRGAERLRVDSLDYDKARLDEMCRISNDDYIDDPAENEIDYPRMRRILEGAGGHALERASVERSIGSYARESVRRERRVMKRSLKVSEQFLGAPTTRLFVSGDAVRITGRLATYEVSRSGDLMSDHGGATLSLRDPVDDTFLCHFCIYTKGVPLLDHLTSLFLHIKGGQEGLILNEGNPYDVAPEAWDRPWLAPYLERSRVPARMIAERDGRDLPHRPLIRDLATHFFDELGDACPPMPETRSALERGLASEDVACEMVERLRLVAAEHDLRRAALDAPVRSAA